MACSCQELGTREVKPDTQHEARPYPGALYITPAFHLRNHISELPLASLSLSVPQRLSTRSRPRPAPCPWGLPAAPAASAAPGRLPPASRPQLGRGGTGRGRAAPGLNGPRRPPLPSLPYPSLPLPSRRALPGCRPRGLTAAARHGAGHRSGAAASPRAPALGAGAGRRLPAAPGDAARLPGPREGGSALRRARGAGKGQRFPLLPALRRASHEKGSPRAGRGSRLGFLQPGRARLEVSKHL